MTIIAKILELLEHRGAASGYASLNASSIVVQQPPAIDAAKITSGRFGMPRMPAGTAGQVLTAQGAGVDPAYAAVAIDFPKKLKPQLTRWVIPGWCAEQTSFAGPSAGRIHYQPIFVSETTTYIRIGINVSTLAAGTADLRIFTWNNGVPGALILSAGTVDTGTTGDKEIVISQQLTRGYYFLAIRCSAAPVLLRLNPPAIAPPVAGLNTAIGAMYTILTCDGAYADPAPAPTLVGGYAFVFLREN